MSEITCPSCNGDGYKTCYNCDEKGFVPYTNDEGERTVEECRRCDGKGVIECTRCWGKRTITDRY